MGGGGGGAAMRSMAARFTAPSIVNSGFRKFPTMLTPTENLPCTEKGFLNGSVSVSETVKTNIGSMIDSYVMVQKPYWDSDGDDESLVRQTAAMPRIVFGGAPTIQEAKSATSDLKEALHKVYLSPLISTGSEEDSTDVASVGESVPENALKAFKLLDENPAIQSVVASIACDPNVWEAVQQNEALVEYLKFQNHVGEIPGEQSLESDDDDDDDNESSVSEKSIEAGWDNLGDFLKSIKMKVMKMVSAVSCYLQSIFEDSGAGKTGEGSKGSDGMSFMEGVMTSGLMGLAIMAILVVFTKRA